jgi:DNA-binding winged helix-turn-helix (wHTH) protein
VIRENLGVFVGTSGELVFGAFRLDVDRRQLKCGTGPVSLSPKAFNLLQLLVTARPRAVPKRELHEQLWPATFVSEATLSSLVAELRHALGERGRKARIIRTVHGYGYAFEADATAVRTDTGVISSWVTYDGREIGLRDGEHVVGRGSGVTVELRSPGVSRHHARIVIAGLTATLEDLNSKNGTRICGEAVKKPVQLQDGDEIRIGRFVLTYRCVGTTGSTATEQ